MSVKAEGAEAVVIALARELAHRGEPWFWLDGEGAPAGESRVSYLGVGSEVREAEPGRELEFLQGLRETSALVSSLPPAVPGFRSGWVVALGYEFGVGILGLEPAPDSVAPGFALRCDAVIAVDHETGAVDLRVPERPERPLHVHATVEVLQEVLRTALRYPQERGSREQGRLRSQGARRPETPARAVVWREAAYERGVEECQTAISRGDAYVLCLTDTAETETAASPDAIYARIRGGAARGGVLETGARALASASPERFLSVRGNRVTTHPIKGTRPRGLTGTSDDALALQLASDPKERAENLMIVDLLRNDLSRVCEPGTVRVERFLTVETHPRVHQLVSTVTGELSRGGGVFEAIAACFPGGSMTGAPKRSAVQILARIEGGSRGLYSGCFGWIDDSGDAELAMTIRGVELRGPAHAQTRRAYIGAGGGVTSDSDPGAERQERDLKAAAVLANL